MPKWTRTLSTSIAENDPAAAASIFTADRNLTPPRPIAAAPDTRSPLSALDRFSSSSSSSSGSRLATTSEADAFRIEGDGDDDDELRRALELSAQECAREDHMRKRARHFEEDALNGIDREVKESKSVASAPITVTSDSKRIATAIAPTPSPVALPSTAPTVAPTVRTPVADVVLPVTANTSADNQIALLSANLAALSAEIASLHSLPGTLLLVPPAVSSL